MKSRVELIFINLVNLLKKPKATNSLTPIKTQDGKSETGIAERFVMQKTDGQISNQISNCTV